MDSPDLGIQVAQAGSSHVTILKRDSKSFKRLESSDFLSGAKKRVIGRNDLKTWYGYDFTSEAVVCGAWSFLMPNQT
jgi:hypothetical protein